MKGRCLFCTCEKGWHTGRPVERVKEKFPDEKWTPTACSNPDCRGCRRYET